MKGREWYQEDETAEQYDEWRFSKGGAVIDDAERRALHDAVGDVDGERVLECACGTGRFSVELSEAGADVVGVDISRPMLEQAAAKAHETGVTPMPSFVRGDGKRLPFPDDAFDLVVAMRFFHLVDEPRAYLSEMARVSRGPVFFDTFSAPSARLLYNRFLPMGSHLYTDDEVEAFVDAEDLRVAEHDADFFFPFGLYRITPRAVASGLREVDDAIQSVGGDALGSVTYWRVER